MVRWANDAPVGHVTGEVVGQPADGEVGVAVSDQQADLDGRVQFAGPQPGADPGVAAPDHQQPHAASSVAVAGSGQAPAGTSSASSCWTRMSMSSRMRRTTSTGWPAGSCSSQSS